MHALKKLIKNIHVNCWNGENEALENTYPSWKSVQIQFIKLPSIYEASSSIFPMVHACIPDKCYIHACM